MEPVRKNVTIYNSTPDKIYLAFKIFPILVKKYKLKHKTSFFVLTNRLTLQ